MQFHLTLIFLVFCIFNGFSQDNNTLSETPLFDAYPFEDGSYSLVLIPIKYGKSTGDKHLYTNDISLIKKSQQTLVGKKMPSIYRYSCSESQQLHLCKDGKVVQTLFFSANCQAVHSPNGHFQNSGLILSSLSQEMQTLEKQTYTFENAAIAETFIDSIKKDNNLVLIPEENWMSYEGSFGFFHENDSYHSDETEVRLMQQFKENFPNQAFVINPSRQGGIYKERYYHYHITVYCQQALFSKFNLYPKDKVGWKAFPITFEAYWKS